jgi:hypothetical protein
MGHFTDTPVVAAASYPPALGDEYNACLRQHIIDELFGRQMCRNYM